MDDIIFAENSGNPEMTIEEIEPKVIICDYLYK